MLQDTITEGQYLEAFTKLDEYYTEIANHNKAFLSKYSRKETKYFGLLVCDVEINGKIEVVEKPEGNKQNENYGMFKNVHVHQWTTNMDGDSFAGFIYAKAKGEWIKIPYYC